MFQDLRFAIRLLHRNLGFAAAAVLTLALGVALNGAVFALVRSVLLRPLPFHDPDRVVVLWRNRPGPDASDRPQVARDFIDWRTHAQSFDGVAAVVSWKSNLEPRFDLIAADRAERLRGAMVTPNFFAVMGVQPARGRVFSDADAPELQSQEVVISDGLWRRLFAADPNLLGRTIHVIGGQPRGPLTLTVIGVLPPDFRYSYPDETELWSILPPSMTPKAGSTRVFGQVVARLKPGVTAGQASAELTALDRNAATASEAQRWRAQQTDVATPFREQLTRATRPLILTLGGVAVLVLLIACVNVANLLLARSVARTRELAIRAALGAATTRLLRQVVIETAVIGVLGSVVGLLALIWLLPIWSALVPLSLPRGDEVRIDMSVIGVCAAAATVAILLGTLSAFVFGTPRTPLQSMKNGSGAVGGGARAASWRRIVVATQVAVVFTLIVGAALLLQSFWRLTHVDLGYDGRQVLTMELRVLNNRTDDELGQLQTRIVDAVRSLPGVSEAAMTSAVPMRGTDWTIAMKDAPPSAHLRQVSPEYFRLMRIPLISGRLLDSHDDQKEPKVAVVSQAFARAMAPTGSVIGRQVIGVTGDDFGQIVGVVGDVRTESVAAEPVPAIYVPRAQDPSELMCLVIRTKPEQMQSVVVSVRAAIHGIAPTLPAERVTTLDEIVTQSIADRRFDMAATTAFATVALLLAIVGLTGVVSRSIVERVREIAVRAALGADGERLRRMVVSQALRSVAVGLAFGVVSAWWLAKVLQTQLFQVHARDPLTFAGAVLFLVLVAALAAYVPARAATRIDPMQALRAE
jgi:predicted permease